ncbi:MAG: hypothetical protein K2N84_01865 [Clostridia bacterium]|nr:hypothetical protein [Clostridia bacterium]
MIKLYDDSDFWNVRIQRKKLLWGFLGVTIAVFLALVGLVTYYILLPYKDPNTTWVIAVTCVIVGLYLIFLFPYMGISFKRCNAYYKAMRYISVGLKETATLPFEYVDDWTTHDGIDVNVAVFAVKNIKRDEVMHRQIFVDGEKDFPPFEEGKTYKLVSQGNLLIEYEPIEEEEEPAQE